MKAISYIRILPLLCGALCVQPLYAQGLGKPRAEQEPASQPQSNPQPAEQVVAPRIGQSHVDTESGETPNPQVLGMELPLLDPSTDTMSYNGAKFDVGNNALVRARFEKYLQQNPDDSTEAKRYRKKLKGLLKLTQKSARTNREVGSETLLQIGNGLYEMNDYEGDGGVSGALASAIASAVSVQYANRSRNRKNEAMQREIDDLVEKTNRMTNRNTGRGRSTRSGAGGGGSSDNSTTNTFAIAHNTKQIAKMEAAGVKNDADSIAAMEISKVNFQSTIVSMLMQRRFDHALIGAHAYRHVFRDGDTTLKLDSDSQAARLFEGGVGMPPTVNAMATIASNLRREVDQNMEAVANMLAQNKLSDATQSLIQAVAVGEYMQSVATFPAESRRRIAEFWSLRRKALTTLNARDYGALEQIAARMKELDPDFDDSMLTSYCAGRKAQSDLHLRNAAKALQAGDDDTFNAELLKAGSIWPKNPNLEKGRQKLEQLDNQDPVREEFRTLMARKAYRTIYNEQDKFEVVALDPELKAQYKEAITLIGTIDGMLEQLEVAARQDTTMGPCMAYEMLLQRGAEDERYQEDSRYRDALNRFALGAHEFTQALDKAKLSEERREYGSALSNYYRAQCLYPRSTMAGEGVRRVTEIILKAKF
ncbi:MAG: hypothetical protein IJE88_03510 [Akkermansia sp.]|nr:hypothetical protein [Akkermansia sp.]